MMNMNVNMNMNLDHDSITIHSIIPLIKNIIMRQTIPGSGHEYGLTLLEILHELNNFWVQMHPEQPPFMANQLQHILNFQIDGINQFETVMRSDGLILYQNPQDVYGQMLFDYPPLYQAEPPPQHILQPALPPPPPPHILEIDQPLPNTIKDLTREIYTVQARIEELKKRQNYLLMCNQMLQNPAQLQEEAKRLEQTVLSLKDMQTMVDEKVRNLISYLDFELNEK
ncbi:hypothetical protein TRFO_02802 [Tritrichomonas foetus]|uniref:Uncharacterized protein n=1 Tax=Tritrichomonas foetus TaxID=1144522 RepID=A0A1J4L0K1_9EUKA|nr:hypothetical protein TRFO_02802 [Tritrichomonas foetus]|eukprot:OHT15494.1 hypothetical protein TRFO_02802 [Tritrichomonas foetus]